MTSNSFLSKLSRIATTIKNIIPLGSQVPKDTSRSAVAALWTPQDVNNNNDNHTNHNHPMPPSIAQAGPSGPQRNLVVQTVSVGVATSQVPLTFKNHAVEAKATQVPELTPIRPMKITGSALFSTKATQGPPDSGSPEDEITKKSKRGAGKKSKSKAAKGTVSPACASIDNLTPMDEHQIALALSRRKKSKKEHEASKSDSKNLEELAVAQIQKMAEEEVKGEDTRHQNLVPVLKEKFNGVGKDKLEPLNYMDCSRRENFAFKFLVQLQNEPDLLDRIIWTDEGIFNFPHVVDKSSEMSQIAESAMLPQIVWCAVTTRGTIGPYFFNSHVTGLSTSSSKNLIVALAQKLATPYKKFINFR